MQLEPAASKSIDQPTLFYSIGWRNLKREEEEAKFPFISHRFESQLKNPLLPNAAS